MCINANTPFKMKRTCNLWQERTKNCIQKVSTKTTSLKAMEKKGHNSNFE